MGDAKRRKSQGDTPQQQGAANMRALAAGIDLRAAQLLADNPALTDLAMMEAMATSLPALHRIWTTVSDETLHRLCSEYPNFYRYAAVMEVAFEKQRQGDTAYGVAPDLQTLPDQVRIPFMRIINEGAALESDLHSLLQEFKAQANLGAVAGSDRQAASMVRAHQLYARHQQFGQSVNALGAIMKSAGLNQVTNKMVKQIVLEIFRRSVALIKQYQQAANTTQATSAKP